MSKALYISLLVGGNIALFLCGVAVIGADGGISADEIAPVIVPLVLIVTGAHLRFIYRFWDSIADGSPRMSPGKAIGFLFIPIFNVYWVFHVYVGFATDYNNYIAKKLTDAKQLSGALMAFNVILMLLPIPLLNWIIQAKTISRICRAVNTVKPRTVYEEREVPTPAR